MQAPAVRDEADLAEAVRSAPGPLRVAGGGTRTLPGACGTVLATAGMAGVVLYEPGALTLVARAGTPLAEVERLLAAEGQRLAFEPPDHRALVARAGVSTLGGVVAANASGPRRVQAGACRDALLGVRFVDGTGAVVRNGGRVMKNVTGLDLARLMAGSRGRLGVLTEVALKVLPAPGVTATLTLPDADSGAGSGGAGAAAAVAAMTRALGLPYEVSGAAWVPGAGTHLRIEGFAAQVAYRIDRLRAALGDGAVTEGPGPWAAVRDVAALAGRPGDIWRVHARATDAPGLIAQAGAEGALLDWGGALVWLLLAPGTDLRARLGRFAGHATRVRGEGAVPARPPAAPGVAALEAGLAARFDPRGVFAA